jgi:hypothetical protein
MVLFRSYTLRWYLHRRRDDLEACARESWAVTSGKIWKVWSADRGGARVPRQLNSYSLPRVPPTLLKG